MEGLSNIKSLFEELTENPEKVSELTAEQITELRRYNNPYGPTNRNEDADGYVCLSVTNLQEKYLERLYMVALTSFLYRIRQEYDSDEGYMYCSKKSDLYGEYVRKEDIKTELHNIVIPDNNASLINRADDAIKEFMTNKMSVFQDFANLHMVADDLRSDLVRKVLNLKSLGDVIQSKLEQFNSISMPPTSSDDDSGSDLVDESTSANNKKSTFRRRRNELKDLNEKLDEEMKITSDALNKFNDHRNFMELRLNKYIQGEIRRFINFYFKYNPKVHLQADRDPVENDRYRKALEIDPKTELPSNVFESFRLYKSANYDEIVKEVEALWALKPEIENTITIFEDGFQTEEEAMAFKDKNKDTFTVQVHIVKKGRPYFLSAYKANREKLEYYNKHTEILASIEKRVKEDEKVGEKLLKKRVRKIKEANIEKEGQTSEGMNKYMKENPSAAASMGAQKYEMLEENEVLEIPVYSTNAKGMTKANVYVEADGEVVSNIDKDESAQAASSSGTDSRSDDVKNHAGKRLEMSKLDK